MEKVHNTGYSRAREKILAFIDDEGLQSGDRLPSLNKLVEMYDIGRYPFQQAIKMLIEEGYLESIRGSGVYITENISKEERAHEDELSFMGDSSFTFSIIPEVELTLSYAEISWHQQPIITEVIRSFEKRHSNIKVSLTANGNWKKNPAGSIERPDIVTTVPMDISIMHGKGWLFDISPYIDVDSYCQSSDFSPEIFSGCAFGDRFLGIPAYLGIPIVIANQKEWVRKGLGEFPEGWDFAEYNGYHSRFFPDEKTRYFAATCSGLEFFIGNNLLELYEPLQKCFSTSLKDYREIENILTEVMENRNQASHLIGQKENCNDPIQVLVKGRCVVAEASSTLLQSLEGRGEEYTVLPYPPLPRMKIQPSAEYLSVTSWTEHPQECAEFLNYFLSEECQQIFTRYNRISLRHSVNRKYYRPPSWQNPEYQLRMASEPVRAVYKDPLLRQSMNSITGAELLRLLVGDISVRESITNIIERGNNFMANFAPLTDMGNVEDTRNKKERNHEYQTAI